MAIISIPSTIGGVTIPGTAQSGPLGALFGSQYSLNSLQYPRDLGSMTKGHVVSFSIYERTPQNYGPMQDAVIGAVNSTVAELAKGTEATLSNLQAGVQPLATETYNLVGSTATSVSGLLTTPNSSAAFSEEKDKLVSTISLYMPDTVNFQYGASYDGSQSLLGIAESTLGTISSVISAGTSGFGAAGAIVSGIAKLPSLALSAAQSPLARLALSTQGLAINPKQQMLFTGIDFRTYQMVFTFTPYSRDEANEVKNIIRTFKQHAAPRLVTGAGMFWVPPSIFKLDFLFNGKKNPNVSKVAESVIESIDVNYSPNGQWSAHDDGAPIQTVLTINFKEIKLIHRDMIEKEGY